MITNQFTNIYFFLILLSYQLIIQQNKRKGLVQDKQKYIRIFIITKNIIMMMKVLRSPRESHPKLQFSTLTKVNDLKNVKSSQVATKGELNIYAQKAKINQNKLANKVADAIQTRNKIKLSSPTARSLSKKRPSLEQMLNIKKQSIPTLLTKNIKKLQSNETQLINLIQSENVNETRLLNNNSITTFSRTPVQTINIQKVCDKKLLKQISHRLLGNDAKSPVEGKGDNIGKPLARETFRKSSKITGPPTQSLVETKHKIDHSPNELQKSQQKHQNELKQFNQNIETCRQQNFTPISTPLRAESRKKKQFKKRTLRFQLPSPSQSPTNKKQQQSLINFHQQLFENKQRLQNHILLCLSKLNSKKYNNLQSIISLHDMKTLKEDVELRMDEVLEDINAMLESLRTSLKRYDEGSFHRELLVLAKISVYETVKPNTPNKKLTPLLQQLLSDISPLNPPTFRTQLRKFVLHQLSSLYFTMKQYKKSISTHMQLVKLGHTQSYLKIGQMYMLIKQHENSIRYHQKYATERKFDLQSKVKLAHAYSKVPQYYLKTIDTLTSLLIAPGYSSKFKQLVYDVKPGNDQQMIESAVILLSSLYFKNDNVQKAIELCESYARINIKNYRVMHILGGYYRFAGNEKKAFQCYLNALQNHPGHHKSLIQLTEFICNGTQYKTNAIKLLRKCFALENRNFELLKTLIKFLKQDKDNCDNNRKKIREVGTILEEQRQQQQQKHDSEVNYKKLLEYAQILTRSQHTGYWDHSLYQQATVVYQWALSLLQTDNLQQIKYIYRHLGEICLKQGYYHKSERYYKLYLLQIERRVNNSALNKKSRQQEIQRTKIEIYYFLGKLKKHQRQYQKAITYFTKSLALQLKYHVKLQHHQGYFHYFEVGYCHFLLQDYLSAIDNFLQQKQALLTLISIQDNTFFHDELKSTTNIPVYLLIEQVPVEEDRKMNYLKGVKFNQNQTSQKLSNIIDQNNHQIQQIDNLMKKNYLENQLYLAFCYDKCDKFFESKEIYKKILDYFKQAVNFIKKRYKSIRDKSKKEQIQLLDTQESFFKCIVSLDGQLNPDYRQMKRACLSNLATIYKLQGIQTKYQKLSSQCLQLYPLDFDSHWSIVRQKNDLSNEYTSNSDGIQSSGQEKLLEQCTIKRMATIGFRDQIKLEYSQCFSL